jgi:hypothetical protein
MRSIPAKEPQSKRHARKDKKIPMLLFCCAVIALLLIVSPWEPTQKALNASPDGTYVSIHSGLYITEVMSDNTSALPDENGNFPDWVELWNSTGTDMGLGGITLSNRPDKAIFLFPDMVLPAGQRILVYCDKANENNASRPLHAKFKLSSIKCAVYVFDTTGYVLDSVEVPTLNADEVYARGDDGTFARSENYTPGYENTAEGHTAYLSAYTIKEGTLRINEIMPAPGSGLRDEDGELQDWVELYNAGMSTITLSNYALSDNEGNLLKWYFPDGAVIPPNGYYVVFCSGKDRVSASGAIPHTNFRLGAEGEVVTLSNRLGQIVDRIVFETLPKDCSYGRDPITDTWKVYTLATPGASNDASGAAKAEKYMRATNLTGVYVTEVMSSNDKTETIAGNLYCDWAELYNSSKQAQDISGFGLSDNINWPRKWRFPQGTVIFPGEYKIILLDKSAVAGTNASSLHANFALARAGGETITFSDATGRVLDKIAVPELRTDISYGRTSGQEGFFYYDAPTPGNQNGIGFEGFATMPVLSQPGGLYPDTFNVSISVPEGTSVRYTLDGSIPTLDNSIPYTQALTISDTTVLRARAFMQGGYRPSTTVTATYVMKTYYSMPVICLVTDPNELWNEQTGIYAAGAGVDLKSYTKIPFSNPTPVYRQHGKEKRPGYCEMFDNATGKVLFSQGMEIGLIGQYSLDMPQKSFKVVAKSAQGAKYFNAKLFDDRDFTQYKSFVLRVSGNDCVWTRMADGVQSRLVDKTGSTVIHQAWKPVIVYLNGQYWGQYNLRERVSRYFVAQHEGMSLEDADSMDILEANNKAFYGSASEYKAFITKVKTLSPGNNQDDLQYILDRIDVDNYFDYIIFEAFFANTDTGNIRYYKVTGGKWRWILYDMDYGLFNSTTNGIHNILNPKGTGVGNAIDNTLIRRLLDNSAMRDKFLRRFGVIFRMLTTEVMLEQVNECYNILEPEMQLHFQRWADQNLKSISSDQPQSADGCIRYWNERVNRMRNVVMKRPTYCYEQVQEFFNLSDTQMLDYFGEKPVIPAGAT